jgi:hypothetical protein
MLPDVAPSSAENEATFFRFDEDGERCIDFPLTLLLSLLLDDNRLYDGIRETVGEDVLDVLDVLMA